MSSQFQQNILVELNSQSSETSQEQDNVCHDPFTNHSSIGHNQQQTVTKTHSFASETRWHSDIFDDEFHKKKKKLKKSAQFSEIWNKNPTYINDMSENKNQEQQKCLSINCSTECQNKNSNTYRQIFISQDDVSQSKIFVSKQLLYHIPKENIRSYSDNNINQQQQIQQDEKILSTELSRKYSLDQSNNKQQIILQIVNQQIYLRLGKQVIEICQQTKVIIDQYFLKRFIIVPLAQSYIFTCKYATIYWKLLLGYLANFNVQLFKQTMIEIAKIKKTSSVKSKKTKISWMSLTNYFTKKIYSKAQMLKNHTQNKLSYLQKFSKYNKNGNKEEKQMLQELAHLQMIISFEKAIEYFQENQKENGQTNEQLKWKELAAKTKKQMKKWISQHTIVVSI